MEEAETSLCTYFPNASKIFPIEQKWVGGSIACLCSKCARALVYGGRGGVIVVLWV